MNSAVRNTRAPMGCVDANGCRAMRAPRVAHPARATHDSGHDS
jgi:hypothetical protein